MRFRDAPFKTKMTILSIVSSLTALVLAGGTLATLDWIGQKRNIDRSLSSLSDVIGSNSTAALVFNDPKSGRKTLAALKNETNILSATLYNQSGKTFVTYHRPGFTGSLPNQVGGYGRTQHAGQLYYFSPIFLEHEQVGSIGFIYDLRGLRKALAADLGVILVILCLSFFISLYFASRLKRLTSEPILHLAEVARRVTSEKNYSYRATKAGDDDLGRMIDDFNAMLVEIQKRTEEAEAAIRLRDEFISIAAHELRTPLTTLSLQHNEVFRLAMNGSLGKMTSDQLLKKKQRSDRQFERFTKLIDELLDVSRISTGKLNLDREETDLSILVQEIATELAEPVARAHCTLKLEVEPGVVGRWDQNRVGQVLSNLILNATKYGAGKPIVVRAERQGAKVLISIQDFGIGIAKADQGRIFDKFERAVSLSNFGGFGLGLFIARQNVIAHGGEIWVESIPGSGSTFTFSLPLDRPSEKPSAA